MHEYILPHLHYIKLRFHLTAQRDCSLPSWKGSLLRGAFGHALRRTVCTMQKNQACRDCMLRTQCAYTRMFETFVTEPPPRFLKQRKWLLLDPCSILGLKNNSTRMTRITRIFTD
ncbi:MAG: hypothetical protein ACOY90_18640 [Candidatus Zhuqueibacterota bacterium]